MTYILWTQRSIKLNFPWKDNEIPNFVVDRKKQNKENRAERISNTGAREVAGIAVNAAFDKSNASVDLSPCRSSFFYSTLLIPHSHTHLSLPLNHGGDSLFFTLCFLLSPQTTFSFPNSYRSTTSQVRNPKLHYSIPIFQFHSLIPYSLGLALLSFRITKRKWSCRTPSPPNHLHFTPLMENLLWTQLAPLRLRKGLSRSNNRSISFSR